VPSCEKAETVKGNEDVVVADEARAVPDGAEKEEGGTSAGVRCGRCSRKGHVAAACTFEAYCVICDSNDHVNHRCPVLKMPRPVAHAVGYAVHGLGFYHIPRAPLSRARKDSKMAVVAVEGGQLSKEEVKGQLERLFPGKWMWELREHEGNSFITKFPSKMELQRAIAFGGAMAKGEKIPKGVRITFDVWQEKEVGFLLPKVWVRVFGLRKELREFLELWAVGTMLGSTQTVDMEETRKNNYGRVQIAVLNPALIPAHLDVVIADHYFELEFEVERIGVDENGEEAIVEWNGGGAEGEKGGKEGAVETMLEREAKRSKLSNIADVRVVEDGSDGSGNSTQGESLKEYVQNLSEEEFKIFLKRKAKEIIDMSVDRVLEEAADKVMAANEDVLNEGSKVDEVEEGEGMLLDGSVPDSAQPLAAQVNSMVAGSDKNLEEAASIPELITSVRSSPRLVGAKNEHTLVKAGERMAKKNLEFGGGMPSTKSEFSLKPSVAANSLQQIGLFVGSEGMEVNNNMEHLLSLESFRGEIELGGSVSDGGYSESEEENIESMEANALKILCGELMEEVFDEDSFPLSCELRGKARKYKSHAKSCLFRTCKERKNKVKIRSQK
jgi:hypothetical protein